MNLKRLLTAVGLMCAAASLVAQDISYTWTGSEATRLGRLFRNGVPTIRRNTTKAFPGLTGTANTYPYTEMSFTNPNSSAPMIATVYTYDQYATMHMTGYNNTGPGAGDMSVNYIGDQGSSVPGVWSVLVPTGTTTLVIHMTATVTTPIAGQSVHGRVVWSSPPTINDYAETGDAPDTIPGQTTSGSGTMTGISGSFADLDDVDIYKIQITDPTLFTATCQLLTGPTSLDTQIFLFDSSGNGVTMNDDTGTAESAIGGHFVTGPGTYYIAISQYDRDPVDGSNVELFTDTNPDTANLGYRGEWVPTNNVPVVAWDGSPSFGVPGTYIIDIQGATWGQASTTIITEDSVTLGPGIVLSGVPSDLNTSNDVYYTVRPGVVISSAQSPIVLTWIGHAPGSSPSSLSSTVEARAQQANCRQTIEVFNYSTALYEQLNQQVLPTSTPDTIVTSNIANPSQHIDAANGNEVKLKISYKAVGPILSYPWRIFMDQVIETYTP